MQLKSRLKQLIQPKTVEIEGVRLKVPSLASAVIREAIYQGSYEATELRLVKARLREDDVVMEIGTGLGLLSAYCAQRIGNDRVFTFEANPELEQPIRENYRLNKVSPNLKMNLVGKQAGWETLYVGDNFWSSSIFDKPQGAKPVLVPAVSFNETVRAIDPSFLIVDIEGGEINLVEYADFHNIRKLLIEIHSWVLSPGQIETVKAALDQQGFHLVEAASKDEFYFERR